MAITAEQALQSETIDGWHIKHSPHENMLSLQFEIRDTNDNEGEFSFEGWVSFDGCIHWRTDPNCYAHSCEPADIDRLKRAFEMLYVLAAQRLPKWRG